MPFTTETSWVDELDNILSLGSQGKTLREIGEHYGVSKQRVQQICSKYGILKQLYGKGYKRVRREEEYKKKWGDKTDTDLYRELRQKFRQKKANALRLGKIWTVSFGDLDWPTHCPILGLEIDYFSEGRIENSCSFDQIIPNLGYTKENTRIVSWRANRIKNDGTAEEHRKIYEWMSRN